MIKRTLLREELRPIRERLDRLDAHVVGLDAKIGEHGAESGGKTATRSKLEAKLDIMGSSLEARLDLMGSRLEPKLDSLLFTLDNILFKLNALGCITAVGFTCLFALGLYQAMLRGGHGFAPAAVAPPQTSTDASALPEGAGLRMAMRSQARLVVLATFF